MQKRWQMREENTPLQRTLGQALGVDPIITKLLINRGITRVEDARQYLSPDIARLHDPFLLKGMQEAVRRIKKAARNHERVLIFGDYDVDGITSSVILYRLLRRLDIEVINHIPRRMEDGYGLNHSIAAFAKSQAVTLLIAVDCGTTAHREIEALNCLGIDVIVIDHHEPPDGELPNALAVINPKQSDCAYPFKYLASAGLAAKLTQAFFGDFYADSADTLELTALGTVADVAALCGENRTFVREGLARIAQTKNKGLLALLDVAKIKDKKISPFHIGFVLGPRLNAAGRMDNARASLDLLLSTNFDEAYRLAKVLDQHNLDRQKLQRDMLDDALSLVEQEVNFKEQKVIVLNKEGWHKGVLGIVASKLKDKYYRPSIVISTQDGIGTASARSIEGFHLHEALQECSGCLENFGGHAGAAGLTIRLENIDPFRQMINQWAEKFMDTQQLIPTLLIDCEIPLSSIRMNLVHLIEDMEPFGEGNPSPIFCTRHLMVKSPPMVLGKDTLKFWVTDGHVSISAVGFGMAEFQPLVRQGQPIDLAYQMTIDDWNKSPTVQLQLKDIKESCVV